MGNLKVLFAAFVYLLYIGVIEVKAVTINGDILSPEYSSSLANISRINSLQLQPDVDTTLVKSKLDQLLSDAEANIHSDSILTLKYANQIIELAERNNAPLYKGEAYNLLSYFYGITGSYQLAIDYSEKSIIEFTHASDTSGIIQAKINKGLAYLTSDRYSKALNIYLELLPTIYEYEGNSLSMARIQANIGYIYIQLENYESAKKYLIEAHQFFSRE